MLRMSYNNHLLSIACLSICLSVPADAKYIPRLAFLLMSGLFHHCGVKIGIVGLKNGVKKDQRKIKGN